MRLQLPWQFWSPAPCAASLMLALPSVRLPLGLAGRADSLHRQLQSITVAVSQWWPLPSRIVQAVPLTMCLQVQCGSMSKWTHS